ncbi:hypothetical protein NKG05_03835 [Oerskovia sp. M15]
MDALLERAREDEFWRGVERAHLSRGDQDRGGGLAAARERLTDSEDDRITREDAW